MTLRAWLVEHRVTQVAMEATSSYWLPLWRVLEEPSDPDGAAPFQLLLCNARHIKHVPGRKTDVTDACWLNRPGLSGGSYPWKPRRSHVSERDVSQADDTPIQRRGEGAGRPYGAGTAC